MQKLSPYRNVMFHVIFWLVYILYRAVDTGWQDSDRFSFIFQLRLLTDVPVAALLCYVNFFVLLPLFFDRQKYVSYAGSLLLLLLLGGIISRYIFYAVWVPWDRIHEPAEYLTENKNFWLPVRILRDAAEAYPLVAVTTLIRLMRDSFFKEKKIRETEKAKFLAELSLLRAQVNPHFFFNTLTMLYALTIKRSDQASQVVLRLSELMRYMIYDAGAELISLRDELLHLENYIEIEQLRFGERLNLDYEVTGEAAENMIAPLLMLPFVENAFKHGIENAAGWIKIFISISEDALCMKISNNYSSAEERRTSGVGLKNVKRRLELLYPGRHELLIEDANNIYNVQLKLKL